MHWKVRQAYDTLRYDLPRFLGNLYKFRKALWNHRSYDYTGLLMLIETATKDMHSCHKNHGHLMKAEETAKELLIVSEICKRLREDEYSLSRIDYHPHEGKGFGLGEFTQKEGVFPKYEAKSFHKLTEQMKKDDLKLLCKIIERKLFSWWD